MISKGDSVLIGVSGGTDSVALTYCLIDLKAHFNINEIGIAHFNHSLRGKESDQDALFVEKLACKLNLPYFIQKQDVRQYQYSNKLSLEEAARCLRYKFYDNIAKKNAYTKIAIGHHMDDNAELILMYMLRGSGTLGLSGMPHIRGNKIIRPLINISKKEILHFLKLKQAEHITDSSNNDTNFLRNHIRHNLIPFIKQSYNPSIVKGLNRMASILKSEDMWLSEIIEPIYKKIVISCDQKKIVISSTLFNELHIAAKRRVIRKTIEKIKGNLRKITFDHIDSIIKISDSKSDELRIDLPDKLIILKNKNNIIFIKEDHSLRTINYNEKNIVFKYIVCKPFLKSVKIFIKELKINLSFANITKNNGIKHNKSDTALFDIDKLSFPLIVRNINPGDRFIPLGMKGSQKIKNFFINNKIPKSERKECPVLVSGNEIIWVIGYRISDIPKITSSTQNILLVNFYPDRSFLD